MQKYLKHRTFAPDLEIMDKMNSKTIASVICALAVSIGVQAQVNAADSVFNSSRASRLSVGGYGEVAYSRNFYSDHVSRYSQPEEHKDDPSHGRFDLPHVVVYLGYDFGKGWSLGSEIEFEHGGAGLAYEKEDEEGGEWEQEVEKGGEVELEQFWLQKTFSRAANLRFGHIVVPVGLNNAHHEPLNFFTVYRPEGENTILPSTWHQTGLSFFGRSGKFRYEAQLLAALNADNFTNTGWIHKGHKSPMEYDVANKYGAAARNLDDKQVQRGKVLFTEMGCAQCHRPSWKTGEDKMWVDASTKAYADANGLAKNGNYYDLLPRYPYQTIWPYTDMVQHRLFMKNDIRTGWCRTTPLWGRGLSRRLTGADDRLHDCRARTVVEAIMWHGYSKESDAYNSTVKFYNLSKEDRDAVVKFIEAI